MPKQLEEYLKKLEGKKEVVETGKINPTEIEQKVDKLADEISDVLAAGYNEDPAKISAVIAELTHASGLTQILSKEDLQKRLLPKIQEHIIKKAGGE